MEMRKANHRKSNTNTETDMENPKGKNHGEMERDSSIITAITMVILWYAWVSGLN